MDCVWFILLPCLQTKFPSRDSKNVLIDYSHTNMKLDSQFNISKVKTAVVHQLIDMSNTDMLVCNGLFFSRTSNFWSVLKLINRRTAIIKYSNAFTEHPIIVFPVSDNQ